VLKHGKIQRSYRSLTGFKASSTYFCDKGFYLDTPSSKRTCLFGQWIGKDPVCLKSSCPPLDDIAGGTVKLVVGKDDGWAIYQCNNESTPVGSITRQCLEGKWLGKEPSCVMNGISFEVSANQCNFPEAPEFGGRQIQNEKGELVALYNCSKGYNLVGSETITCSTRKTQQIAPTCLLSVFGAGDEVCDFSDTSKKCHYVSDANSDFQWNIEKSDPCPVPGLNTLTNRPGIDTPKLKPVASIQLKPLPPDLQTTLDALFLPKPSKDLSLILTDIDNLPIKFIDDLPSKNKRGADDVHFLPVPPCSDVPTTTLTLQLPGTGDNLPIIEGPGDKLQKASANSAVRDASPRTITDSATFEVGPLMSSHAKYIKFTLEAPMNAVSYAVFVGGHCLPDPPGTLYPVHFIPPSSNIDDSYRTVCLNLHSKVLCNSNTPFSFSVRVTLHFIYVEDQPGTIRFTPRGSYRSFADAGCLGFKAENE
jgi:hypothetical protein